MRITLGKVSFREIKNACTGAGWAGRGCAKVYYYAPAHAAPGRYLFLRRCPSVSPLPAPNGLRYLRWGGGRRSRPTGKMLRRRKLLEMCAESPASGARFVRRFYYLSKHYLRKERDVFASRSHSFGLRYLTNSDHFWLLPP